MSKFLVTGGAGFIGSHIVETLVKAGQSVRVLDNFSSGKKENLSPFKSRIELVRGDIRDKHTCLRAVKGMDFILHQAALRSVPKSMLYPEDYNHVNIGGTLNMLEAAAKAKVRRFVFASSSSVYGDVSKFPQKEDFLPKPISPYALTKLTGEHYCKIFSLYYGLPTVCLRYFNVFGPRQSLDDEYAVVIPKFITCLLKNVRPPIFGNGKQSRDFTYVVNVARANILATQKKAFKGDVFNVALGKDYTVLELVQILNRILGKNIKPVFLKLRPGDVFRTNADVSKVRGQLGLISCVGFIEGLKQTVEYFRGKYE
jgi:nucleoside-diphosphate-sugar epimerase